VNEKNDLAASFQETAFLDVLKKAKKVAETFQPKAIFLGGGVANNQRLRTLFKEEFENVFFPPPLLSVDNAVMIAGLGEKKYLGVSDPMDLEVQTRIPIRNLA
jgi:N6-L-threonylcarbamoyladenine synthase